MHTQNRASRTAFQKVCDESSHGRVGTTVVMCPKCYKVVKSYTSQVNGFNEWAYKKEYDHASNRYVYHTTDFDGRSCCV